MPFVFSRTLSKITTVSYSEYPRIVRKPITGAGVPDRGRLVGGQAARLHPDAVVADDRDPGIRGLLDPGIDDGAAHIAHGRVGYLLDRCRELRPARELDAELQPASDQSAERDGQQDRTDEIPPPRVLDDRNGDLAAIEAVAQRLPGHGVASLAAGAGARRPRPVRPGAPSRTGSSPDQGWPAPKKRLRASTLSMGLVNRNTTIRSTIVVSPSANAKPRTLATENT